MSGSNFLARFLARCVRKLKRICYGARPHVLFQTLQKCYLRVLRPSKIKMAGILIPMGPHITQRISEFLFLNLYETFEIKALQATLESSDTVIELGTGLGVMAALSAKKVSDLHVNTYELNPELETPILELFRLNQLNPTLHLYGLGAEDKQIEFFIQNEFWISSSIHPETSKDYRTIKVHIKSFDQEVKTLNPPPNYLIVDIEGGEYELFSGSTLETIQKILVEVHPDVLGASKIDQINRMLEKKGFIKDNRISSENVWFFNRAPAWKAMTQLPEGEV